MSINITTDNNTVTVTSTTTNKVNIVDNGNNTTVSVSQPTTRVIRVATVGPQGQQGPAGAIPSTGSFAITGSNSFIGNQSIQGDLLISGSNNVNSALFFLSGASVSTIGSNIDMTAGPGGWSEIGSNNGQNYVWVDDNGLNLVASWDGNTETSAWRIATGSRQLIAVGDLNMNGRSITGSLVGTASFATSASYVQGYVLNSSTSSFVTNSQTSSFVLNSSTSSFVTNSQTSSFVLNSSTSSFVTNSQTSSFATTGSITFTGPQIVTGSTRGNVTALTITSNTASMNLSVGNFFTLQLVAGTNTHINPSNILPGQTSMLTISTVGSATVSFPSSVKQPSGSAYIPTTATGVDILTFASVDSSSLYVVNVKNMI